MQFILVRTAARLTPGLRTYHTRSSSTAKCPPGRAILTYADLVAVPSHLVVTET